jgi:two-component system chemotaxis response regulator CheB
VALAASAGGLEALSEVLRAIPTEFPLPILIVQHLAPQRVSHLAEILGRRTGLRVKQAEDHEVLTVGTVYIAPPDRHLTVDGGGRVALTSDPRVHFVRPSADTLFESLVACFHGNVLAVVLSGSGVDGAEGAASVQRRGGAVIVQDQSTAYSAGMPSAAIGAGCVERVLPLRDIAAAILALVKERAA